MISNDTSAQMPRSRLIKPIVCCGKWRITADPRQWILQRQSAGLWRNVAFVSSTSDILARCLKEEGCPPWVARRLLRAVSMRFSEQPLCR